MIDWIKYESPVLYEDAIVQMEQRLSEVIKGDKCSAILMLEHQPVYTMGSSGKNDEILADLNAPLYYTGRGGKVTYHGPGQLIIYPILDLKQILKTQDLHLYVRKLEEWMVATLKAINIDSYTIPGKVGIWTNHNNAPAKIGAIGIRVKKWVSYHGIAININCDLDPYKSIIPCGISNYPVTSLMKLGVEIDVDSFSSLAESTFYEIFK